MPGATAGVARSVAISAAVALDRWVEGPLTVTLTLTAPDGSQQQTQEVVQGTTAALALAVTDPQLWWPNGYGAQPLYQVEVSLADGAQVLDRRTYQLGLRTIELRQAPDEWGTSFTFVVNGVPIFAKGSNWIPADSFPTRLTDAFLEQLIHDAALTHQNMLRVWGGGFYEEERFYDLCDRYGILVWQDFIFSCSIYPLDREEFLANVRQEVVENVRRLRHRASLALWCGNNEMEQGWEGWGWAPLAPTPELEQQLLEVAQQHPLLHNLLAAAGGRPAPLADWQLLRDAYERFFFHTLPAWVSELDPDRCLLAQLTVVQYPVSGCERATPGRRPLLGCLARAPALHCLSQPVSPFHERVRLPGAAPAGHRAHLCG